MKNILHVVNIYFVLPYFIGDQFRYFASRGYGMHVICSPSDYLADYAAKEGFEYMATPVNRKISPWDDIRSFLRICRYIRRHRIDTVVGHTPKGGLLSMTAALCCRVPRRIYFRHGLVYETSHGLKRFILMSVDRISSLCATMIVCVSPSVLERSIADRLAPKSKQIILGHGTCNGVDTVTHFNPANIDESKVADLKKKYGIDDGDFVIGYSGRLVRDKGIIDLVRAFDILRGKPRCKLMLVGMFEVRDALPEDIRSRIVSDSRIIYTGFINGGMEYYYSLMDVYILPSYREGFPTGVLEAQAMAKPVITTRATGCCDSIVDGVTGLFCSHDPADIAAKIDDIRLNHSIDGEKGREWTIKYFDSRLIWREIEKLY